MIIKKEDDQNKFNALFINVHSWKACFTGLLLQEIFEFAEFLGISSYLILGGNI